MTKFARQQWFLLALGATLVGGALFYQPLRPVTEAIPQHPLLAVILWLMSAPLDLRRSLSGRHAVAATGIAVAVNTLAAGPLAWVMGRALIEPLAIGLVLAALSPCTMASAAVWTRRGGGNDAIALMVTVVTSLLSVVSLPGWAWLLIGKGQNVEVDAVELAGKMLVYVVLPIGLAQAMRGWSPCRLWCDRHRHQLSLTAQLGLLLMVLIGAVRCGELLAGTDSTLRLVDWGLLIVITAVVHVVLFALAWYGTRAIGAPRADMLAAAVSGSQKTLAVGLSVAMEFGPLAILPMIVYHTLQLLIDAVLVEKLGVKRAK
ncbi:bile acid:sodium symporter family protein [Botrimarina mediterranea]|uniref:Sodium Bile acid symporter family protein n=1 Tax=Botrimarina mediterranea TaxID=2528022 RepID=A0A518KBY6_9BACT|nr:bile acid:sodium symporter [Botrimarina mediterranea]QDV75285.1 Sodium Bile acid symporter family protein [Botrimarina mediterranea]